MRGSTSLIIIIQLDALPSVKYCDALTHNKKKYVHCAWENNLIWRRRSSSGYIYWTMSTCGALMHSTYDQRTFVWLPSQLNFPQGDLLYASNFNSIWISKTEFPASTVANVVLLSDIIYTVNTDALSVLQHQKKNTN